MHGKLTRTFVLFAMIGFQSILTKASPGQVAPGGPPQGDATNPDIPSSQKKDMEKKANEQRHADLKRDTDKLLQLSTELKQYVDKSNENILSVDVVKRAEEIEKLAHSVKVKMKGDN